jgi:hypothetical protein
MNANAINKRIIAGIRILLEMLKLVASETFFFTLLFGCLAR